MNGTFDCLRDIVLGMITMPIKHLPGQAVHLEVNGGRSFLFDRTTEEKNFIEAEPLVLNRVLGKKN